MLHNFGGNLEMYGRLDVVGSGPIEAATSHNSTMVLGLFPLEVFGPYLYIICFEILTEEREFYELLLCSLAPFVACFYTA